MLNETVTTAVNATQNEINIKIGFGFLDWAKSFPDGAAEATNAFFAKAGIEGVFITVLVAFALSAVFKMRYRTKWWEATIFFVIAFGFLKYLGVG